jgi:hypothetical protein
MPFINTLTMPHACYQACFFNLAARAAYFPLAGSLRRSFRKSFNQSAYKELEAGVCE